VVVAHDRPDVGEQLDPLPEQQDDERFLIDGWSPPERVAILYIPDPAPDCTWSREKIGRGGAREDSAT
jgi:hypothetical protein